MIDLIPISLEDDIRLQLEYDENQRSDVLCVKRNGVIVEHWYTGTHYTEAL